MATRQRNIVLHFEDGVYDKVYISQIRESNGNHEVVGRGGRRGKSMAEQVKLVTDVYKQAETTMYWLAVEKENKGYKNIQSVGYHGILKMDDPWLEKYLVPETGTLPRKSPVAAPPRITTAAEKRQTPREVEMVCINNSGYENHFDKGVEYICIDSCVSDPEVLIQAYDKFGDRIVVYRSRFKPTGEPA